MRLLLDTHVFPWAVAGVAALPAHHQDPLDRVVVVQALAEPLRLKACGRRFQTATAGRPTSRLSRSSVPLPVPLDQGLRLTIAHIRERLGPRTAMVASAD